jgi:hypothetical protein
MLCCDAPTAEARLPVTGSPVVQLPRLVMTALHRQRAAGATLLALIAAVPAEAQRGPVASSPAAHVPTSSGSASVRWNQIARDYVSGHDGSTMISRPLALLSVAQWMAATEASANARAARGAVEVFAVATASAEVLTFLYPNQAARFQTARRSDRDGAAAAGLDATTIARADSLGRAAAARVIGRARTDGSDAAWRGTVPSGAGHWRSAAGARPVGAEWAAIRPWVLRTADQLRPAAPPAPGTDAFAQELEQVREASRNRTPAQLESARKWAAASMPEHWNAVGADLVALARLPEARAGSVLAMLNVALMDANIACFDAKYAYWSVRPSQADPGIDVPVALPNFPAYPSGHACLSAAAVEVLGRYFPARRDVLDAMAREIADSRLYAGVHYRLDNEIGLELGREVARLVVAAAADPHSLTRASR